jgi:uncharacterized membrane protein
MSGTGAGYWTAIRRRPRLLVAVGLGLVAYVLTPWTIREASRALVGWNVGAWGFLALIWHMIATSPEDGVRRHAADEDEKTFALLVTAVIAALFAMAAIVWELGPVKDLHGASKALHLGLVAATTLSAWAFTHMMFALHYAAEYYQEASGPKGVQGGLVFPTCEQPGWGEFCYQAFVIGCACATADVNVTTSEMRVACLAQGVVAFFFNTIILALTINISAGLF